MKKILFGLLVLISIQALGQNPPGYQSRIVRERIQGSFMVDSTLHIPRYNGTPSGVRVGGSVQDGALAMDTTNHILYMYSGGAWLRIAKYSEIVTSNIYTDDGILEGNRLLTGLNNTYYLAFDSLNYFRVDRDGVSRMYMSSAETDLFSPDGTDGIQVFNNSLYLSTNSGGNYLRIRDDSSLFHKRASYEGNIHSTFFPYSLVDKSYVDSAITAGGGGTPGGSDTQVQFNDGGSFGGDDNFTWDKTNNKLGIGSTSAASGRLHVATTDDTAPTTISTWDGRHSVLSGAGGSTSAGLGVSYRSGTSTAVMSSIAPGIAWQNLHINASTYSFNSSGTALGFFQSSSGVVGIGTSSTGAVLTIKAGTSTAGTAPLKFLSGTNLATTEAGAIEYDGTHLYYTAVNSGPRYQLDRQSDLTKSKGAFLESPGSSEAMDVWQTPVAITISSLKAILRGSSPSVTYNIKFGTDITSATDVFTAAITCTSITTGCSNSSGFNDATIPAGSFIWIVTTASSGTINSISWTINYTED